MKTKDYVQIKWENIHNFQLERKQQQHKTICLLIIFDVERKHYYTKNIIL